MMVIKAMATLMFGGAALSAVVAGLVWHSVLAAIVGMGMFGLGLLVLCMVMALVLGTRSLVTTIRQRG